MRPQRHVGQVRVDVEPARVERLLHPPKAGTTAMFGLALALVSAVLVLLPGMLAAVAGR